MASKSDIEAARAYVRIGVDSGALSNGLKAAESQFKAWGKNIAVVGAAITGVGASIKAPFHYALSVLHEDADALRTVARQTAIDVERLGPLAYGLGGNMDAVVAATRKMQDFIDSAQHNTPAAIQGLREMGLTLEELNGVSTEERFLRLAEGINRLSDAATRGARAQDVFGRGYQQLVLTGGREGIEARAAHGASLGAGMRREDVEAAHEYGRAVKDLGIAWRQTLSFIGGAIAPYMTTFLRLVIQIVVAIQHWADSHRPLLLMIFQIGEIITATGVVIGGLGSAIYAASFAFRFMGGAIGIVSSALRLLTLGLGIGTIALGIYKVAIFLATAAISALSGAYAIASAAGVAFGLSTMAPVAGLGLIAAGIAAIVLAGPSLGRALLAGVNGVGSAFASLGENLRDSIIGVVGTFRTTFGAIVDYIMGGNIESAFGVAMMGLDVAWLQTIIAMRQGWADLTSGTVSVWDTVVTAIARGAVRIYGGLVTVFINAISAIRTAWYGMALWMGEQMNTVALRFETAWIRARESFNPLGSEERTQRLVDEATARSLRIRNEIRGDAQDATDNIERERITALTRLVNQIRDLEANIREAPPGEAANPELDRLRGELALRQSALDQEAFIAEQQRFFENLARPDLGGPLPGGRQIGAGSSAILGGFSAQSLFGIGRGSAGPSPLERAAARQIAELERHRRLLEEIARVAGARFS